MDPASDSIRWDRVWFLYASRDYEHALEAARQAQRFSRPNYLFQALIEQGQGEARRSLDSWLERFQQKGVALPDAEQTRKLADSGPMAGAYRELLAQVAGIRTYRESAAVVAVWQMLAGDPRSAAATLSAHPDRRDSWMLLWLDQIPLLAPLKARPETAPLRSPRSG